MIGSIHPLNPIALELGPLTVQWYGLLIGLAVFIGYLLANHEVIKRGLPNDILADIAAPSILLGQAIGRWGNFMNQKVYGGEVNRQYLENIMLPEFIINQMYIKVGGMTAYYQPTFLYESLWSLLGLGILLLLRKVNLCRGELFITYAIWYSVGRFFIEGIRTDYLLIFDVLRTAQVISVITVIGGIILIIYRRKNGYADKRYLDEEQTKQTKNFKKKGLANG